MRMNIPDEAYIQKLAQKFNKVECWIDEEPFSKYSDLLEIVATKTKYGYYVVCIPYEFFLIEPDIWGILRGGKSRKSLDKYFIKGFVEIRASFGKGTRHLHFHSVVYLPSDKDKLVCGDSPEPLIEGMKYAIDEYNSLRTGEQYGKDQTENKHVVESEVSKDYTKIFKVANEVKDAVMGNNIEELPAGAEADANQAGEIEYERGNRRRR